MQRSKTPIVTRLLASNFLVINIHIVSGHALDTWTNLLLIQIKWIMNGRCQQWGWLLMIPNVLCLYYIYAVRNSEYVSESFLVSAWHCSFCSRCRGNQWWLGEMSVISSGYIDRGTGLCSYRIIWGLIPLGVFCNCNIAIKAVSVFFKGQKMNDAK